jgi:hypothetical protein
MEICMLVGFDFGAPWWEGGVCGRGEDWAMVRSIQV